MAKTKYIARYEGTIVGKRSTDRTYQFAVIVQDSEQQARDYAYAYKATEQDRKNYDYYSRVVAVGVGGVWSVSNSGFKHIVDQEHYNDSKTKSEGGFDAYVAYLRDLEIKRFEKRLAEGGFKPGVAGWCGRRDLADKLAAQQRQYRAVLAIVPAELA